MLIDDRQRVPVTIFAGARGAGKTTTILRLLNAKPEAERWTVIIDELGRTMPDPGVLAANGISIRGAPYGCPCCTGNTPMRVVLGRAVRETRPQRVILEVPWGSHLGNVVTLFEDPLIANALSLAAVVAVVDQQSLNEGILAAFLVDLLGPAGVIVVTGSGPLSSLAIRALRDYQNRCILIRPENPDVSVLLKSSA